MIYSIACNDSFGVGLVCLVRAVLQAGLSVPGAASPQGPRTRRLRVSSDTGVQWVPEGLPISSAGDTRAFLHPWASERAEEEGMIPTDI